MAAGFAHTHTRGLTPGVPGVALRSSHSCERKGWIMFVGGLEIELDEKRDLESRGIPSGNVVHMIEHHK